MSNETWGRERVIAHIGRLDECGRKADRRRDSAREYILTVRFNEDGDAVQALLSPSTDPMLAECVDWQMREFARPGDRPPQRKTFRVHVPLSFSPIGGRATPAPEQPFADELTTRD
ncbi:hypothetical protein LZC95_20025 [Pendulispora brunnea]|uniref:TonB C-terminal domain-containing protein n=1 Tax=Pendulispora brunnea TaxID=2905690 RepID=A0ABZ2KP26_9BACT